MPILPIKVKKILNGVLTEVKNIHWPFLKHLSFIHNSLEISKTSLSLFFVYDYLTIKTIILGGYYTNASNIHSPTLTFHK